MIGQTTYHWPNIRPEDRYFHQQSWLLETTNEAALSGVGKARPRTSGKRVYHYRSCQQLPTPTKYCGTIVAILSLRRKPLMKRGLKTSRKLIPTLSSTDSHVFSFFDRNSS